MHEEGFKRALTNALNAYGKKANILKGDDKVSGEDCRVGKGDNGFRIGICILHGYFYSGIILLASHINNVLVDGRLIVVKPGDIFPDAPV